MVKTYSSIEEFLYNLYNAAKKRDLLISDRRIMVSYKLLKHDIPLSEAGFHKNLRKCLQVGYLVKAKRGVYVLTDKGYIVIQGYELGIAFGRSKVSGGVSPSDQGQPLLQKLLPRGYKGSELYKGIRLHNVKVQFKVLNWPPGLLAKDITADPYFTMQVFKDQDKVLLHLKQVFRGISPSEVMMKLMKYILMVIERLYKEYGINVAIGGWDIKHWEWAYQFDLKRIPTLEGLEKTLMLLAPHLQAKIDYSEGLLEIETNDDMWAMLFFLQPFISLMTYNQALEVAKYLNAYETQIARHLKVMENIQDGFERFNTLLDRFMRVVENEKRDDMG